MEYLIGAGIAVAGFVAFVAYVVATEPNEYEDCSYCKLHGECCCYND